MEFTMAYLRPSVVQVLRAMTIIALSPNLRREPAFLEAGLKDPLLFRDALLTLHDVVVSDFDLRLKLRPISLVEQLLDPLITVAPDCLFFEAFSQDESSYARVTLRSDLLDEITAFKSGTTNVDFSRQLVQALAKIHAAKDIRFKVEREGFEVAVDEKSVKVKKVDVPDSWLRGFLNVQAAMTLPMRWVMMSRSDLHALLTFLQRHHEKVGPRALVFRLKDGKPAQALFEPWNITVDLPKSNSQGDGEIRVWGRRRLLLLRRILPKVQKVFVGLIGSGYPSFWICDLGDATFTLGISGWTFRPFKSAALHLLKPRETVSDEVIQRAASLLQVRKAMIVDELNKALKITRPTALTILGVLCEQGKAMMDIESGTFRWREVTDLPIGELQMEVDKQREANALKLVQQGRVEVQSEKQTSEGQQLSGIVKGDKGVYKVTLTLDEDGSIVDGECECQWFRYNHLRSGPCKHLLALRFKAQ
ncbi:MAG: SWIM zinc finger domain-containing protein [Armatimonadetes bacterium]|nr:SWIM zinc finger domain-containing protein [Armatimonadota bacterium]MDW8027709.1 SWIM zinc finger family protein [Armatimonadota bacterium]